MFVISLGFCALYSFLETTITAMRLFKLKEISQSTSGYKNLLATLEEHPHRIFSAILIASCLANVAAANAGSAITQYFFGSWPVSYILDIILTSAAILVFGDVIPKNVAKALGDKMFPYTLGVTAVTYYALSPFVYLLVKISDFVVTKVGEKTNVQSESITSEKEIQFLIDYIYEKGLMETEKTAMLRSIFKLGTTGVREIMIPSTNVIAISSQTSQKEALERFKKYQYSRFPVYDGAIDNIIGMLHLKDLFVAFLHHEDKPIKSIVRPILFIPESIKVNQLLKEFKTQQMHIAMVLNEHGSIIGLVTLEDVLEEIVGEIRDEYEEVNEKIIALKHDSWLVDASVELDKLAAYFNITFETEDAITLSGFLIEKLQRLPKKGDRFTYKTYNFQIQQASQKRILQVLIFAHAMPETLESTD
ncbi:MAG: hemolysin family protein [Candidatus Babeliaceae bacterium]|nr:hemolysin family protein [Candidatus Babeliaceae bacterium]